VGYDDDQDAIVESAKEIAHLQERETYLEMVIEAFLIQYGPQGVANWAIEEARDARAAAAAKGEG